MLKQFANILARPPQGLPLTTRLILAVNRPKVRDLLFMQAAEKGMLAGIAKTIDKGMTPRQRDKLAKVLIKLAKLSKELGQPPKQLLPILQKLFQLRFGDTKPVALNKQTTRRPALRSRGKIHPKGFFPRNGLTHTSRKTEHQANQRLTKSKQVKSPAKMTMNYPVKTHPTFTPTLRRFGVLTFLNYQIAKSPNPPSIIRLARILDNNPRQEPRHFPLRPRQPGPNTPISTKKKSTQYRPPSAGIPRPTNPRQTCRKRFITRRYPAMKINESVVNKAAALCRQRGIVIPTFAQMRDPSLIPAQVKQHLKSVGLWDVDPVNLFRITWKNEPVERGGLYGDGNWIEFPSSLTGVDARIVGIVGKWFPTGAHKVGAAFGCIVPRLVTGEFDPTAQKAVWPSTGNYCRGGAFDCALLGCHAIGILPEEMSRERFEWLREIGAEVIATPGCESNVKEIYDKCWEIRRTRPDCVIFNQFEEFGNAIWHYHVTGGIIEEIFQRLQARSAAESARGAKPSKLRLAAYISSTGSAGTIAAGDFLKTNHANLRTVACEALQCPTLLQCGFGGHRIEGIGDKHIPWIHNVRNTDVVAAIDDEQCIALMRLFNEEQGQQFLIEEGVTPQFVAKLPDVGISGICNLVTAIKTARMFDMDSRDVIFMPLTDSMGLYGSRIEEYRKSQGPYSLVRAARDYERWLLGTTPDHIRELTYFDRKMLHNFKYFTWVEQQQRGVEDLRRLWDPNFWTETFSQVAEWDRLIEEFNARVSNA